MALFSEGGWKNLFMILVSFVFMYLAIAKGFEPLLLLPISFGMLLTNLPMAELYHPDLWVLNEGHVDYGPILRDGGLLDILYLGVKLQLYPPLIFLGIGCMTDFSPLIANPRSFLLGAAAQGGIFFTFVVAGLLGFTAAEA
ncbi:MAG: sodium ion-translocating decarboxylase subunit beta, partial [Oscillospiraceae bacterium]|nr:sodium ion-translocating decarboxylase subunit beta [Oscillospiraceae bacterium]